MKILMLNFEYPPIGGGVANATRYILHEISKMPDIEVDLITSSPNKFLVDRLSWNVNIHKLNVHKKNPQFWRQSEIIEYSLKSYRYIRKIASDHQIIHALFGIPCGFTAYLFRKKFPYIVSLQGFDVPGFNIRFSKQHFFLKPIIKKIWANASRVIACSRGLAESAHKTSTTIPIDIIPYGVDTTRFIPDKHKREGIIRIICVSRLVETKGIDYLIKAVSLVVKQFKNIEVIIVGKGNLENQLKKLSNALEVSNFVKFLGFFDHNSLPTLYNSSDIFVFPSKIEGMSNSMLEAMASGLPIICTYPCDADKLIQGNGIVIEPEKPHAMADSLLELIKNTDKRLEMGRKSREIAKNMTWNSVAERYCEIYREIARTL